MARDRDKQRPGSGKRASKPADRPKGRQQRVKRPSRVTVPICTDELDSLVAATSNHPAVGAKEGSQSPTADRFERADPTGHPPPEDEDDDILEHLEPVEEFSGAGSSISEALTSVTDQYRAVRAILPPRPASPPKHAQPAGSTLSGMGDIDPVTTPPRPERSTTAEHLGDDDAFGRGDAAPGRGNRAPAGAQEAIEAQLGDLEQVPSIRVPLNQITWHKLDHQAGFLLSRIDGELSYGEIITVSGMKRADALRTLAKLVELKLIAPRA